MSARTERFPASVGRVRTLAAALTGAALASSAFAQIDLPDGFAIESVALFPSGSQPTGFAFLPDGRVVGIERTTGQVRLAATNSTAAPVIGTIPGVTSQGERGLLGVAVDPGWPLRPYLYFHFTHVDSMSHLVMYTASGALNDPSSTNVTLQSPYVLLNDIPDRRPTHNGGTLRFGPDGSLYMSVGDDVHGCEAQDISKPAGKILRLEITAMPGPGTGPPNKAQITPAGNPFTGGEWQRLVYAYGLRNPFRFTIDARTSDLCIGDVGLETWEEIDLVQPSDAGQNCGWPEFEGPLQDPDPIWSDCSTPPFGSPIHVYPNPPVGVAAIVCGPLYRTSPAAPLGFPRRYEGDLFFTDFYGNWIRRLERNGDTWSIADSVPGQPSGVDWARIVSQIADLQQGPDGALYFMSFVDGAVATGVHRIVNTLPSDAGLEHGSLRVQVVPNPASSQTGTRLHYRLARASGAWIRIYDPAGRCVRTLRAAPSMQTGIFWDGRSLDGVRVASGVYVFELRTDAGETASGKIALER